MASAQNQKLKILMLHEKHIQKTFPGTQLSYPTGPLHLRPSDVPGYDHSNATDQEESIEAYGWWRHSDRSQPPEYAGLEDGLQVVARTLIAEGPFDGVVGFSQGAALAAMVASLLGSADRSESFRRLNAQNPFSISFPPSFRSIEHPPLKFCVVYSGFVARGERYHAFYDPQISTPSCHFIGSLDNVVEESRSRALIEAFGGEEKSHVVYHPGGHFLPSSKHFLDVLVGFIRNSVSSPTPVDVGEGVGKSNDEP